MGMYVRNGLRRPTERFKLLNKVIPDGWTANLLFLGHYF